jgi:tRNA-splicing ligase RtcB
MITAMYPKMVVESEAVARMEANERVSFPIIGTEAIRTGFDEKCIQQAINSATAPGIEKLVLNPDAHAGYGAPVGCVMTSASHIYPGPVGVDIKCSMSLLQTDLPHIELASREVRRAVINAILSRIPTGAGRGQRSIKKGRYIDSDVGLKILAEGAAPAVCKALGIPEDWITRCEDPWHRAHDGTSDTLFERAKTLRGALRDDGFSGKIQQLGSYGGGNHFGEANIVSVRPEYRLIAEQFGLRDQKIAFLSHCGSRGIGYYLADQQFKSMQQLFKTRGTPFPGNDRELVYAELGSIEANSYLNDMAMGANFATANHLLINALVLEAFQEVFPGLKGNLVYFISHNIARQEIMDGRELWVHRKGSTRAFPAGHPQLIGTPYADSGHPILLPGNPQSGSAIMVAKPGAALSCYSVNHGAGRTMSRTRAKKALVQSEIDADLLHADIISNCRQYPRDEAPAAYKDFHEVVRSVELAGLADTVALLKARFVIKDGDDSLRGAA